MYRKIRKVKIYFQRSLLLFCIHLLCYNTIHAQENTLESIKSEFFKPDVYELQERIFLHTDKEFYVAGEIIWVKAYLKNEHISQSQVKSSVVYIDILDRNDNSVLQSKLEVSEKGASGSIYIPLELKTDNYTIRAYTSWMKTHANEHFYEKKLTIVNTITNTDLLNGYQTEKLIVSIAPEGGDIVEGLENRIGIKITDAAGKSVEAKGVLVNQMNDTVTVFETYKFGMGNFRFLPKPGDIYKLLITSSGFNSIEFPLTNIKKNGYVMNVIDNKDNTWKVTVQSNSNVNTEPNIYLITHAAKKVKNAQTAKLRTDSKIDFFVNKNSADDGINYITLFDESRQPVCERLVFKKPIQTNLPAIVSQKNAFSNREEVLIDIRSLKDSVDENSNYSVSVFADDDISGSRTKNITQYYWLEAFLGGEVEAPDFYFSDTPEAAVALENLLLNQGWRRFTKSISQNNKTVSTPELDGHTITVKVTNRDNGNIAPGVICYLSFPAYPFGFVVARSDKNGIVQFQADGFYGPGEIIVQGESGSNMFYNFDVTSPFSDKHATTGLPQVNIAALKKNSLLDRSISMQTANLYWADSLKQVDIPTQLDSIPFFGKAEFSYNLDDYKRFTTMEEVLREYVLPVTVTLRAGKPQLAIYNEVEQKVYPDNLLVMIDGVPLKDYQNIFTYDPLKIKNLKVVPRRYMVGEKLYNGIVSFVTYSGKFDAFELTPELVSVDYEGLQLQRQFYAPSYRSEKEKNSRTPDFRTTLYWNPDVEIDSTGHAALNFYTSDQKGKFNIVLQGFGADGKPVSVQHSFIVE